MTGKELAKELGISEAAVSFALNNKPGVSTQTRNLVKEAAKKYGMQIDSRETSGYADKPIYLIYYKKHGAILSDTSFFSQLTEGVEMECQNAGFHVHIINVYDMVQLTNQLQDISMLKGSGIILFGTEMQAEDLSLLNATPLPTILLDNHFLSETVDSVQINNMDGAYMATDYLIQQRKVQPGYLHSSYLIRNFQERKMGFEKAVKSHGMSRSKSPVYEMTPSVDGAYADMLSYIDSGEELPSALFADNDLIAIGAMRALKERGYHLPEDIAIIGFDDIPSCNYIEPALTTIHVPTKYMGQVAAQRLIHTMHHKGCYPVNIQIQPHLVKRHSIH